LHYLNLAIHYNTWFEEEYSKLVW